MGSLTSTWINAEKTDLILMPKGSTSKSATLSAHAVLLLILWLLTLICEHFPTEKAFPFLSEDVQSVFSSYWFGCSLTYMVL